jgi:hypothetical protein
MNSSELSRTYTDRSNCRKAAKRECGEAFEIEKVDGGFAFRRLPPTRFPGAAKAAAEVTPGLKRLRSAANAETLRKAALADQAEEMRRQEAKHPAQPDKTIGKRAAILAAAQAGNLPAAPDFSAATHARFRGKLADLVKLAEAGDIEGLKRYAINPISSSPKALDKFRNLCVIALEARALKKAA